MSSQIPLSTVSPQSLTLGYTTYLSSSAAVDATRRNNVINDVTTPETAVISGMSAVSVIDVMKWIYLGVGVLGISCNTFVIYVIARSRSLQQQPRNWLILNKSVADLIGAVVLITVATRSTSTTPLGLEGWLMCTIWYSNAPLWICYVCSEYILVALTVEVFLAIVYPVLHKNVITTRRLAVTVVIIWLCTAAYHLAYMMATSQVVSGVCYYSVILVTPTALPAFVTVNFFLKLFFPASIFVICYIGMALSLKSSKVGSLKSNEVIPAANQMQMRASRNIYYTLSYTLLLHFITWSGNQVEYLLFGYGYAINSASLAYQLPLLAIYVSSFTNPIIYTIKYERFRRATLSAFPFLRKFDIETRSSINS